MSNNRTEAANGNDDKISEAPPSRDSLFDRVKAANDELTSRVDVFKKFLINLFGTGGRTICIGILLAVLIAMIVIALPIPLSHVVSPGPFYKVQLQCGRLCILVGITGAMYRYTCYAERMIPIYLIVAGTVGIFKTLSYCRHRPEENDPEVSEQRTINPYYDLILTMFLFAWFIAGNVWIYGIANGRSSGYGMNCKQTLYYFAFWVTTATNILIGLACCCVCFLAACCNTTGESKVVLV